MKEKSYQSSINTDLLAFSDYYKSSVKSNMPLLNIITTYILKQKGKQIRPVLVFLSAKICSEVTQSSHTAALMIELLHTATLVHDDVVDDSMVRRGAFSINALWKSKTAVLVGDYLLAKGLLVSLDNNEFELLKTVSEAVKEMSEGELLQMKKALSNTYSEQEYFDIILKKTASLMAACTKCGAISAGADALIVNRMHKIGLLTGIIFQLKDDLMDYQKQKLTGKTTANDLKEKKLTLPLIYALSKAQSPEGSKILKLLKSDYKSRSIINEIIDFVVKYDGIQYTNKIIEEYKESILKELDYFEDSEAKSNYNYLINFIIEREK